MPLPDPTPDLMSLDLLVTVGELGSIRRAAAAHGISQPAASTRLRALEQVLGIQLLERSTSGARLSPAGQATAEWSAAILGDMRTLLTGTAALRSDQDSHLRLAASLTVAEYLLPRWLHQLSGDLPATKVSLEMGNTAAVGELVVAGDVDLGFIEGSSVPRGLRSRELLTDDLVIITSPSHPWQRRRRPLRATDLAATPLVVREPGSGTRQVLAAALAEHGLALTPAMELGSTTAIKAAIASGDAPSVVSARAVSSEIATGQLKTVSCLDLPLRRIIRAVWAPGTKPGPAASRLLALAAAAPDS